MHAQERIANLVVLISGVVFLVFINPAQTSTGDGTVVSPRLLPQICAGVMVFCSGVLLAKDMIQTFGRNASAEHVLKSNCTITRAEIGALFSVTALLSVCVGLFMWTGALVGVVVLITVGQLLAGERSPTALIIMPVVLVSGAYVLFYHVLHTSVS